MEPGSHSLRLFGTILLRVDRGRCDLPATCNTRYLDNSAIALTKEYSRPFNAVNRCSKRELGYSDACPTAGAMPSCQASRAGQDVSALGGADQQENITPSCKTVAAELSLSCSADISWMLYLAGRRVYFSNTFHFHWCQETRPVLLAPQGTTRPSPKLM